MEKKYYFAVSENKPDFHDQVDVIVHNGGTLLHHAVQLGESLRSKFSDYPTPTEVFEA